jgi:septum formation protein
MRHPPLAPGWWRLTRIVLASASPRRRELLAALVPAFEVIPSDIPEPLTGDAVADAVALAAAKAQAVAEALDEHGTVIIGSDTVVFDEERSYAKPESKTEAIEMLRRLRGRRHRVVTGVAVVRGTTTTTDHGVSAVTLAALPDEAVIAYVESGRPMDKAGSYAIQDTDMPTVDALEGCRCCVIGLPLWRLKTMLEAQGVLCAEPQRSVPDCETCPDRPR